MSTFSAPVTPRWNPVLFEPQQRVHLSAFVEAGRFILARLAATDFRNYESMTAREAMAGTLPAAFEQVLKSLEETLELTAELPTLIPGVEPMNAAPSETVDDFELDFDQAFDGEPDLTYDRFGEELDALLGQERGPDPREFIQTCEMLILELKGARSRLQETRRSGSKWAMITQGEEGRRKAQKALRAALTFATRLLEPGSAENLFPDAQDELQTALMVRATLITFRRAVCGRCQRLEHTSDSELSALAHDVHGDFLSLFATPSYRELRSADRYELVKLRVRLRRWLQATAAPVAAVREVLSDINAYADMLAAVNHRANLREHDQAVRQRAQTDLMALRDRLLHGVHVPQETLTGVLDDLRVLAWRDDELARCLASMAPALGRAEGPTTAELLGMIQLAERLNI